MVVGVGGMGTNTVRAVKRRFRNVWGGDQLPGMIQLLALDTEPLVNRLDQEPLFADEFAYMGKFDATRLVANLDQHPEIAAVVELSVDSTGLYPQRRQAVTTHRPAFVLPQLCHLQTAAGDQADQPGQDS